MPSISGLHLSIVLLAYSASSLPADSCCNRLKSVSGDNVFFPGSSLYLESVSSYFFLEQRSSPACIVAPSTSEEVAKTVITLTHCGEIEVAIRSGGHSPNQYFSNTKGGITLDLRRLNSINVSETGSTVSVGTGALWGHVYDVLDPLNKTVVGARVYDVRIGGFLSGGGISFFSPQDGFGCDNVLNMQVVLANGTIVDANTTSHPQLFRALKGGQNNFGVVTRFDLEIKSRSRFWGGAIVSPGAADAAQLDALLKIEQTFVYYGSQQSFLSSNNLFYLTDPPDPNDIRALNRFTEVYGLWKKTTNKLAARAPNCTSALTYQSVPPPPGATKSKNSFPFTEASETHNLVLMLTSLYSPEESDYATIHEEAQVFINLVENIVEKSEGGTSWKYLYYAASWQDPLSGYGQEMITQLKAVASLYDPESFFQNVVKGGFKVQK
ncbi:FAD-binding domain-containing protein [Westerdykella ornata]|uniref:FAD-binding domain-containing protein n=1 Tax=Westerdykella ornata TaxID=318751 RepID=A0A6A6JFZ3_WESOR|nr:FAD-binding domain-containing protein [Westerdykella ornata]KAF2274908.1 FAD-binding domain-containing protein [Westerdykella ornata]